MSSKTELNRCGCCGQEQEQPMLYNRPGLDTLEYRIGVYDSLFKHMLSRLSSEEIPDGEYQGHRPLHALTTRATDDFSIGLIDAWAMVGDVLTFYQERIANEGFLRTAAERRSVLELARAIGYELKPGVAADTYLAFTVDESDTTPEEIEIPARTQVQSLPQKQDELPQTFETEDTLQARAVWNRFVPRQQTTQLLTPTTTEIVFQGINTHLQIGDHLLLIGTEKEADHSSDIWDVRRVLTVTPDPAGDRTTVTVPVSGITAFPAAPDVYAFREQASIFGHNAVEWTTLSHQVMADYIGHGDPTKLSAQDKQQWPDFSIFVPSSGLQAGIHQVDGLIQAGDAIKKHFQVHELGMAKYVDKDIVASSQPLKSIDLDNQYRKIVPQSWVYFATASRNELYFLDNVVETSRTQYMISAKVTRLQLDGPNLSDFDDAVRKLNVFAAPEQLPLAEIPVTNDVSGTSIVVDAPLPALSVDKPLIVSGIPVGKESPQAETVFVKGFQKIGNRSIITLKKSLSANYICKSVQIFGNVTAASHGETVADEVVGHGDGAAPHQSFVLKKSPLTYTAASTVSGNQSTLTLRVDNIAWQEVDSLYLQDSAAQVYTVRIDNQAKATVLFGDGLMGSRLPTGLENITATYRNGIGLDGEVSAGTLTLLKTKPYGVKSVTNPIAADGAEDPEKLENARQNAPMTVRTLDRIVSQWDYEDFAATFNGVGKAQAAPIWDGTREVMHITVADPTGNQLSADKIQLLHTAMEKVRDPLREVIIENFIPRTFSLAARATFDDAYQWDTVQAELRAKLKQQFSFASRQFGQPVTAAEIMAVMHTVDGVIGIDLNELYLNDCGVDHTLNSILGAGIAAYDKDATADALADRIRAAGLLTIHPDGITLKEDPS